MVIFKHNVTYLFKQLYLPKEKMNIQLFYWLQTAFIVLNYIVPAFSNTKYAKSRVKHVLDELNYAEVLRSKGFCTLMLEYSISKLYLKRKLTEIFQEGKAYKKRL